MGKLQLHTAINKAYYVYETRTLICAFALSILNVDCR